MNKEWSEMNKRMQSLLKKSTFDEGIETLILLRTTLMDAIDALVSECTEEELCAIPFIGQDGYHSKTIAYSLWHIFRIEDIVVHSLIRKDEEIFFSEGYDVLTRSPIITTGNELKAQKIREFSLALNISALTDYIHAVKASADSWLRTLTYADLKASFSDADRLLLHDKHVVSEDEEAVWLIDYWCGKDIKGLLQMPLSRHWIMHIEAAIRIRNKLK